jgi:hypothetical protein
MRLQVVADQAGSKHTGDSRNRGEAGLRTNHSLRRVGRRGDQLRNWREGGTSAPREQSPALTVRQASSHAARLDQVIGSAKSQSGLWLSLYLRFCEVRDPCAQLTRLDRVLLGPALPRLRDELPLRRFDLAVAAEVDERLAVCRLSAEC